MTTKKAILSIFTFPPVYVGRFCSLRRVKTSIIAGYTRSRRRCRSRSRSGFVRYSRDAVEGCEPKMLEYVVGYGRVPDTMAVHCQSAICLAHQPCRPLSNGPLYGVNTSLSFSNGKQMLYTLGYYPRCVHVSCCRVCFPCSQALD